MVRKFFLFMYEIYSSSFIILTANLRFFYLERQILTTPWAPWPSVDSMVYLYWKVFLSGSELSLDFYDYDLVEAGYLYGISIDSLILVWVWGRLRDSLTF